MNIVFVYTSPFPAKRGFSAADRRVRDIVRGLKNAGANVTLVIPHYHLKASVDTHKEDFTIKYLGKSSLNKSKLINRFFYWKDLLNYVKKNKTEAIILYNTQADSVFFNWILKNKNIKIITEVCDLHSHSEKFTIKSSISKWTEKHLPSSSDLVITISDYLKSILLKNNPNQKVLKIPILVDSDYFHDKTDVNKNIPLLEKIKGSFLISYVGGLWTHQGVKFLMQAFKKIIDEGLNAKLLIAGNYDDITPNKDDVYVISKELGIEEHIILPGWVDTKTVKNILYASDLLVISQTNDLFAQAGLPTKLAEYAACAKPILITKVGDVQEYFQDKKNCILCEPSDVESMYQGILFAIRNPEMTKEISKQAYETCHELFDYNSNGEIIYNTIKNL
ncbi:MAG: hypothetical protein K0R77_3146 [Chryseobacterium sp.]|jgi:glycosyltransferase involved in cell wall biosynthesis|uniref:glycosyltransferase family 4 protein n=1 Tax=Chryseobacterium sp. TaxID=1871047 RepID=UPI00260FEAAC|nr:glycosyltransferase family 4 protein [Chryseobacterium sp.]MDF2553871.1 hypothetical protein [Chryseobacterium sp.]